MFFITKCLPVIALIAALPAAAIQGGDLPDTLNGPSQRDKIAIIGGGVGGIHMASLLKRNGFQNIKVFEASNTIGGKAGSFDARDDNGNSKDSGAYFVLDKGNYKATWDLLEYTELQDDAVTIELSAVNDPQMSFLTGSSLIPSQSWMGFQIYQRYSDSEKNKFARIFSTWCDSRSSCRSSSISPRNDDFQMFLLIYLLEVLFVLDLILDIVLGSDERYQQYMIPSFREDTAGNFSMSSASLFDTMVVPTELEPLMPFEIMFSTVKPLYDLMLSSYGYGHITVIPAFYLFNVLDPQSVIRLINPNKGSEPEESISMLKGGFVSVLEKLVEQDDIVVETLEEVVDISVGRVGGFTIKSKDNNVFSRGRISSDNFDFVISAIDAAQFSSLIQGADTSDIDDAMSCTTYSTWRVSNARITYKEENPAKGVINMPVVSAAPNDSESKVRGALSVLSMPMAKNGATAAEYIDTIEQDVVLYEINFDSSISQFEAFDDIDFMTVDEVYEEVIHPKVFVRSLDFASCSPWQVLPAQGKDNVWYIGGSVTFESVEAVFQYNHMIVDKFCADSGNCRN